jgi:hypothetical protein
MTDTNRPCCFEHGKLCKGIAYLEKGQDEIKVELHNKTSEIKDTRKSLVTDINILEEKIKKDFVSKAEFDPVKKLVYGTALLMIAEVARRIFI